MVPHELEEFSVPVREPPASSGVVEAVVRIVLTNLDLPAVQQGEVLVTSMTRQDFVPFMRKCSAIITDEGGVGCHAAIIAREFSLPCIVGTKNATKLLKNGSKIKVDAEKGLIHLL